MNYYSVELGPKFLFSEVFSQDSLEAYFSRQRHRDGGCDSSCAQLLATTVNVSMLLAKSSCDAPLETNTNSEIPQKILVFILCT